MLADMNSMRVAVSLGIRMHDGRMAVLLPRNTALPAKVSRMFSNFGKVEILAGEHPLANDNHRLGWIQLESQNSHEIGRFRVSFDIDITGLLTATIEETVSGRSVRESFENFRDVQNVLGSAESRGSWNVLTSLANKLKVADAPSALIDFGSGNETKYVDASNASSGESTALGLGVRDSFCSNHEFSFLALIVFLCLLVFRGQRCWHKRGDVPREDRLIAQIKETDAALAEERARYQDQKLAADRLAMELKVARLLLEQHREEMEASHANPGDLRFIVYDEGCANERKRYVKVECPGVTHDDIEIEVVINGAVVKVTRQPSHGMCRVNWKKRFQFQLEEGHFELQEDEVHLAFGILYVPFRAHTPRSKVFRLPTKHLDLQKTDLSSSASVQEEDSARPWLSTSPVEPCEFQILSNSKLDALPHMMLPSSHCFSSLEEEVSLTAELLQSCGELPMDSMGPSSLPTESSHDFNSQGSQGSDE